MLVGRIVSNQQNRRRVVHVTHAGCGISFALERRRKAREVRGAMMVDVVGVQYDASEFLQQIILFIGGARGTDHADRLSAVTIANLSKALSDDLECLFPGGRSQSPILAD